MRHACVILAAGMGTRMKSSQPKVIHRLYDMPMLQYVLNASARLRPEKIVIVVGKENALIKDSVVAPSNTVFAVQKKQLGTAHALLCGAGEIEGLSGTLIVLNGDMPLITAETLKEFLALHRRNKNSLSVVSFIAEDPLSYGRIIRDERGNAIRIIETTDATPAQKSIKEVNSGLYALESTLLPLLRRVRVNKTKGEYYLTDLFEIAQKEGHRTGVYCMADEGQFIGINTRHDLQRAHEALRKRKVMSCLREGVSFINIDSAFIHPSVSIGKETLIYPNVYLEGKTKIGTGCTIYPNVRIIDSVVKNRAVVKDSTVVEESEIGSGAQVGPFAHIRPGSKIGASTKIGNFVEVKKSVIGIGTKAMHLTYLGDAEIGRDVNIGAGTITCNYDGVRKYKTVIEDGVFVGSDSQLIAPVRLKRGSYVGAGSTITEDVPRDSLAVSRVRQRNIKGWGKGKQR